MDLKCLFVSKTFVTLSTPKLFFLGVGGEVVLNVTGPIEGLATTIYLTLILNVIFLSPLVEDSVDFVPR